MLAAAGYAILSSPSASAAAQGNPNLSAEQTASVAYGSAITFSVQGTSTDPVSGALLHIHVLNRADSDVRSQTLTPGAAFSASATVPVSALQLPAFAQISYEWELQTASGDASRASTQSILYEDNSLPWTWSVEGRDNLFVHWDGQDHSLADITLASAASASDKLADLTGARPSSAIHIYVYPELSSLAGSLRRNQLRVQDWVAAYSVPDQAGIFIGANSGADMLPNLNRDLAHELAHVFVAAAARPDPSKVPGWLNEGLALSSSSDTDPSLAAELDKAIHSGVLLSLNDLCSPNFTSLAPHDAALAYAQSEDFVRYISTRYGASQIKGLLAAYGGGAACEDGVKLVLGAPLADIETQWHGELAQNVGRTASLDTSLAPWLIAWLASLILAYLFVLPQSPVSDEKPAYLTRQAVPPVSNVK